MGPNLGEEAIREFLVLWTRIRDVQFDEGAEDILVWNWSADGSYSAQSAYRTLFAGSTVDPWQLRSGRRRLRASASFLLGLRLKTVVGRLIGCRGEGCPTPPSVRFVGRSRRPFPTSF